MALSTSSYFSNSIVGVPQVANDVDVYELNANPKWVIGTKFERQDGSIFRYCLFGAATSAGQLLASMSTDVNVPWAVGNSCAAPSSTYQMPDEPSGVYPGSLGSRYAVIVKSSSTNGDFEGSYFGIVKGTGAGQTYRIRTNTTSNDPATGLVRLGLCDQIKVALDTSSTYTIVGHKQNDLVTIDTASGGHASPAGFSVSGSTAGQFGWVQTKGVLMALIDSAAMTVGIPVTATTSTTGRVAPLGGMSTATQKQIVGYCVSIGTASVYAGIYATIE